MSTRIHSFVPQDVNYLPSADRVEAALIWLQEAIDAYRIEAIDPGHITFFDCGGGLDYIGCPACGKELDGATWKDWMDASYTIDKGFTLTDRQLSCCNQRIRLEALVFDPLCVFGRSAIAITDTMETLSETEWQTVIKTLENHLGCPLQKVDAHY